MADTTINFEDVRISLCDGIDQEILELKHFMEGIDEENLGDYPDTVAKICERIFYASEGLKKLADVLGFIDCWEENGEPPQLSHNMPKVWWLNNSDESFGELKEWQKEIMFHEGTLQ